MMPSFDNQKASTNHLIQLHAADICILSARWTFLRKLCIIRQIAILRVDEKFNSHQCLFYGSITMEIQSAGTYRKPF